MGGYERAREENTNMCFDVVFVVQKHKNMLVYTCFPIFSPVIAHFYPPLHHNGKGPYFNQTSVTDVT